MVQDFFHQQYETCKLLLMLFILWEMILNIYTYNPYTDEIKLYWFFGTWMIDIFVWYDILHVVKLFAQFEYIFGPFKKTAEAQVDPQHLGDA